MDRRKQQILLAIIQDYIATAEPVGSRTVARKYDLGVSAATVRNEMSDLEELGYIEQPHTSAGRVPSDRGYRYYVDFLMQKLDLTSEEKNYIEQRYRRKMSDLDEVIRVTGELLSSLTDYASITLGPSCERSAIRYIELKELDEARALMIVVTDTGTVEHRILEIPRTITPKNLELLSKVLTDKLKGVTLEEVNQTVVDDICAEVRVEHSFLGEIMEIVAQVLWENEESKVKLDGTLNFMKQPEFRSVEKLHSLLSLLQQERIIEELVGLPIPEGLTVKIGGENIYKGVHDCSLITATYSLRGRVIGSIGVLGPTRMQYSKVVSTVEFMTEALSQVLSKYYLEG